MSGQRVEMQPVIQSERDGAVKRRLKQHTQALAWASRQLFSKPLVTCLTLLVIAIALALPTGLSVLLSNAKQLDGQWGNSEVISLFLKSDAKINLLGSELRRLPTVKSVHYISPAQGLKQFRHDSGFGPALDALKHNPLPPVFILHPTARTQTPEGMKALWQQVKKFPGVSIDELNMGWVKRLAGIVNLTNRGVEALMFLFGLGVLLIVGNTIHLLLQEFLI